MGRLTRGGRAVATSVLAAAALLCLVVVPAEADGIAPIPQLLYA